MLTDEWDKKSNFRKVLHMKNRVILAIEETARRDGLTIGEVVEVMVLSSPIYSQVIDKLGDEFMGLKE